MWWEQFGYLVFFLYLEIFGWEQLKKAPCVYLIGSKPTNLKDGPSVPTSNYENIICNKISKQLKASHKHKRGVVKSGLFMVRLTVRGGQPPLP